MLGYFPLIPVCVCGWVCVGVCVCVKYMEWLLREKKKASITDVKFHENPKDYNSAASFNMHLKCSFWEPLGSGASGHLTIISA